MCWLRVVELTRSCRSIISSYVATCCAASLGRGRETANRFAVAMGWGCGWRRIGWGARGVNQCVYFARLNHYAIVDLHMRYEFMRLRCPFSGRPRQMQSAKISINEMVSLPKPWIAAHRIQTISDRLTVTYNSMMIAECLTERRKTLMERLVL